MVNKEKLSQTATVMLKALRVAVIIAAVVLTYYMAKTTYSFFADGLFANTGEEYDLPGNTSSSRPIDSYVDDGEGVG